MDIQLLLFLNSFVGTSTFFDYIIIFFASYLQYVLIATFLVLLYRSAYPRKEKMHIFWVTIISIVISRYIITSLIRFFYHRPRPFIIYPLYPLVTDYAWSFPSGHSAFFFAMAATLFLYNKKWGVWFFVAALFMNISRVIAGVHYPSDIIGGMIIGIITACCIFFVAEKRKAKATPINL